MGMNKLAPQSIGAVPISIEFETRFSFIFGWKRFLGSQLFLSMGKTALYRWSYTSSEKGQSMRMVMYLHISVLNLPFNSMESEELFLVLITDCVLLLFWLPNFFSYWRVHNSVSRSWFTVVKDILSQKSRCF